MKIEVSIGEVFDKITILEIKQERITDPVKLSYICDELKVLRDSLDEAEITIPDLLYKKLKDINLSLWETEDVIRDKENSCSFDEDFIQHARLDAKYNDDRFLVKNKINNYCDSEIKEQKSYYGLYTAN